MYRTLQTFAGIEVTGYLDDRTIELLKQPRCGNDDITGSANMQVSLKNHNPSTFSTTNRKRRYNIDGRESDHSILIPFKSASTVLGTGHYW